MDLYFSPLACSMATRVALYEAGAEANYLEVDPPTKTVLNDGSDFRAVNPIGLVPTLRTDEGVVLTENAAILQYVADRFPQSGLGAGAGIERTRLHQWLCFIGTELHKGLFIPVLDRKAAAGNQSLRAGKEPVAARLSRQLSEGPRFPARPFQRGGCLSRHGHQLDHGDAADRACKMAEREDLLRTPAPAPVDRQGDRGGVRAVQGRARAEEGRGVKHDE
ncbi:glutathione S-transferase [Bradyrhizobium liaoningense]